jgi:probable F420-dependent oxidoreductase
MRLGIFSFNTEYTMPPHKLAAAVEERGFESFWVPEHTHIPASRDTPYPGGGELPREYVHMSDPWCALAAAAAVTTRIKLGTSITLINQHHPITLAKQVATVDQISGGRVILGVGAGWNVEEMGNHGIAFEDRWAQLAERVEALKSLWTGYESSYSGKFVAFDRVWSFPKPVQKPHPPILVGTLDTKFGRRQAARLADGWIPISYGMDRTRRSIEDVRNQAKEFGRNVEIGMSIFFLEGPPASAGELHDAFDKAGAERVIIRAPVADEREVLTFLDRVTALVRRGEA